MVAHGVVEGGALQTMRACARDGLDADAGVFADVAVEEFLDGGAELLGDVAARFGFYARVDVFGVLTEDYHIHQLGLLHRRRHALEPAHGPQADIQVEQLAQGHIQAAEPAAHRGGERPFDADEVVAEGLHGIVGQPAAGFVEGFLAG